MITEQGRGSRGEGGGGSGGNLSPQLGSRESATPKFGMSISFIFFSRELGSLPKIVGQNRGVFSFG